MNRNPATILYDGYGNPLAKLEGDIVFSDQPSLLFSGIDDDGLVRFINVANSGAIKTTNIGERQVLGEYYFGSNIITGSLITQNLISLENPIGSGLNVYLNKVVVNGTVTGTFTTPFIYSVSRTTSLPTGGTTQTAQKRNSSDSSTQAVIRSSPTATSAAGAIWTGSPGILGLNGGFFQTLTEFIATFHEQKEIVIAPGEAIVITAGPNSTLWNHWVNLHYNEVLI